MDGQLRLKSKQLLRRLRGVYSPHANSSCVPVFAFNDYGVSILHFGDGEAERVGHEAAPLRADSFSAPRGQDDPFDLS